MISHKDKEIFLRTINKKDKWQIEEWYNLQSYIKLSSNSNSIFQISFTK